MQRKRKQKSKTPSYILRLRHYGPSFSVLADTFASLSHSAFLDFLSWNYPRYRQSHIFSGLRTTSRSNVGRWFKTEFGDSSEALRWVNAITCQFINDITQSNTINLQIENKTRDYAAIREMLISDFDRQPINLLKISSILFSVSKYEGLDMQKKWMTENLFVKTGSFANVLHYFKGVATEGGRDPLEVTDTIYGNFVNKVQDDNMSGAIFSVIFGMPLSSDSFACR